MAAVEESNLPNGAVFLPVVEQCNSTQGNYSSIPGGVENTVKGHASLCGGGIRNQVLADGAIVGSGYENVAESVNSGVLSGAQNRTSNVLAGVLAGQGNEANGAASGIVAGLHNTTRGTNAIVTGGEGNDANGLNSFVHGRNTRAEGDNTFAAGDGSLPTVAERPDTLVLRYSQGYTFHTGENTAVIFPAGADGPVLRADRDVQTNLRSLVPLEVLYKLQQVPIYQYNGPMAQDWYAVFPNKDKKVSTDLHVSDLHSISLAAIQGLYQKLSALEAEVADLRRRVLPAV